MEQKITKIRKRDGSVVLFQKDKIEEAIWKAAKAVGGHDKERAKVLTEMVIDSLLKEGETFPSVEKVQDRVEKILIEEGHAKVAKAYILYRRSHDELRNVKGLFDTIEAVDDYIGLEDWMVKENSNMGFSLQGLNNYIATKIITNYWMRRIYPEAIRKAHLDGDLHIHDLGCLGAYCVGWDLKDLLSVGFTGVPGKVSCKPPKHLSSALGQAVNFFYTLQGETAGAQAFSNFDTLLAPFIRYDKMDYAKVKSSIQSFLFNMSVPTRVGFQTPFTNVTLDLKVPEYMKKEPVIRGGEPQKETYGEFQEEMDMFNKAFAECMMEGDALGRVFTFPIPTYNITKDFDWENPNYDLIWEMTAKYGIPYFSNFINSDMNPEDARSMCPLAGNEKVLIRSSRGRRLEYGEISNIFKSKKRSEEYEIFSDGRFVKGKFNSFKNQKMIRVLLENGHEIKMSEEHLNFVSDKKSQKVVRGKELTTDLYLPYSLKQYKGEGGNEELGFFVGAYAGDGSFDGDSAVVFSLEGTYKKGLISKLQKISEKYFGANCKVIPSKKSKLVTLRVNSKAAVGICKDFVEGKEREKFYKAKLFGMSLEFRKAVLEGHYATDGGNRNRIYTSSKKMVQSLNMLVATLGTTTSIYEDLREGRYGKEPNYAVLIYKLNRSSYGDIWFKKENRLWVKIKEIKNISNSSAYCFEVKNGAPLFTIGTTGVLTHNCRLRLDQTELRKRGGGLFGSNPQTGSIGVVTINLPRLGFVSIDEEDFLRRLESLMELSKESLEIKRKAIENLTDKGLYPYSKFYLRMVKQRFGQYWKNHFATIGLIGMNEAIMNFIPGENITTDKGRDFALRILNFMREKLEEFQTETGNIYNLEATPGESTGYRFARLDRKKYGKIIVANEQAVRNKKAEPYYTNSTQLPVNYTPDIFEALELQDPLQTKYTGGTVLHGFIGEKVEKDSAKRLVKKIAENFHLPYFTITPTFSICPKHGYIAGDHEFCPKCDEEINYSEKEINLEDKRIENATRAEVMDAIKEEEPSLSKGAILKDSETSTELKLRVEK
jgi:anaerobic ribonucleoside-triphosphate reductase